MAIKVYEQNQELLHIGREGENFATTIIFDVSKQINNFGIDGNFSLLILQENQLFIENENISYNNINKTLEWNVTNNYVLKKGEGKCQIVYIINNIISKSDIYNIIVTEGFMEEE